ncbi:hypothetical protein WJX84_012021 [Apatococcus fuscideae]|uniref:Shewanella-like protein phosphatase 2 n=1 Tax=Apatococcus fuscideae TaxID=2026836 RepID=A0AAW1T9W7_9CHLO
MDALSPAAPAAAPPSAALALAQSQEAAEAAQELREQLAAAKDARKAALAPGGVLTSRFMARHPVILQIGSNVFVHAGLLPSHVEYGLERINRESQQWMLGQGQAAMPSYLAGRDAVVWTRNYSQRDSFKCDCDGLARVLDMIPGASRMIVGHTIQRVANAACDGKVHRIDVGMSKGCKDRTPQVMEIVNDNEDRLGL